MISPGGAAKQRWAMFCVLMSLKRRARATHGCTARPKHTSLHRFSVFCNSKETLNKQTYIFHIISSKKVRATGFNPSLYQYKLLIEL